MNFKKNNIIKYFKNHGGVARFSPLLKAGFHSDSIKNLETKKEIVKIGRGLYQLASFSLDPYPDYLATSLQVSKGVICLTSALYFHRATSEIPRFVDIAIPSGARASKVKYPPVRFYHFSVSTWEAGIEEHYISGHKIKIYCLPKTIADCFKFRNKVGVDVAREAIKIAINEKNIDAKEIMRFAKICRVDKIIKPILVTLI